jgi:hypothetical protein
VRSVVCTTEVIVVKPPGVDVELTCGGAPMVPLDDPGASDNSAVAEAGGGTLLGKRYVDDEIGIEVLCTKPGAGELAVDGRALSVKGAKPLPSSD